MARIQSVVVEGVTDLKDYFYNQLIDYANPALNSLFIKLYLQELVPKVLHPGSTFAVKVLFSSLSISPYAQFTNVVSGTSVLSPTSCTLSQTNVYTCAVPMSVTAYGTHILQLVDSSGHVLNDNHLLRTEIILRPTISSGPVPSKAAYNGTDRRFLSLTLSAPLTVNVLDSSYCFIGPYKIRSKAVIKSLTELMCEINGKYYTAPPVCVELSVNDGYDLTTACAASVSTYRLPIISSFAPKFVASERVQGAYIYVTGAGFTTALGYACSVSKDSTTIDYVSLGTVLSDTTLSCEVKKSRFNATYSGTLQIYADSVLLHTGPLLIIKDVLISSYSPSSGPDLGGTIVVLTLSEKLNLLSGVAWKCRVSATFDVSTGAVVSVDAKVTSETSLSCVMPDVSAQITYPPDISFVTFYISVTQYDLVVTNSTSTFIYYKQPVVASIVPKKVYIDVVSAVKVTGSNFLGWSTFAAKLVWNGGEKTAVPLYMDSTDIVVPIPSGIPLSEKPLGYVAVEVSNNGIDYTSNNVSYAVWLPPTLLKVSPSVGSKLGGNVVQILGSRFNPEVLLCKFGNTSVTATYVSSSTITCTAPQPTSTSITKVNVSLVFDPDVEINNNTLTYEYAEVGIITAISPSQYALLGGANVTITGNFASLLSETVNVLFGSISAAKVYVLNSSTIIATVPASSSAEYVGVTLKTATASYTNELLMFEYTDYGTLQKVVPDHGLSAGENAIMLQGVNFTYSAMTFCVVNGTQRRQATFVNSTLLSCVMPSCDAGPVSIELEFDGIYLTASGLKYTYELDIEVSKTSIALVPISGGVTIKFTGRNFPSATGLTFRIGDVSTQGTYVSGTEETFVAPAQAEFGVKEVRLSTNGYNFVRVASISLYYYKTIYVTAVTPSTIPAGKANTITISGQNFPVTTLYPSHIF